MKIIKTIVSTIISILCLQVAFADPLDWVDNPAGFAYTASLNAAVVSNGSVLVSGTDECGYCCVVAGCSPQECCANGISGTNDILAAFGPDGSIQGLAVPMIGVEAFTDLVIWELRIGSDNPGETITFQYFDASEDQIYILEDILVI